MDDAAAVAPASGRGETAVVALTMGGPARPEEVQPFLQALFADPDLIRVPVGPLRRPFAWLVSRLRAPGARRRYALVGGSPLVAETRAQVAALEEALAPDGIPVRLALAYGQPDAAAALTELSARGARRVLALPLYPQRSGTTSGASLRDLRRAAEALPTATPAIEEVPAYPTLPGLISPLAEGAREAVHAAREAGRRVAVLATAHGIPERYLRDGDPYVDHVELSFAALEQALRSAAPGDGAGETPTAAPLPDLPTALGYQSRIGPVRWVGPQVEEVVERFAGDGVDALVVVPLTFVCEHLETRYDLDLSLKATAWQAGIRRYHRVPAVGTHPAFIAGLADHVRAAAGV